jgi:hypothetical protein
MNTVGVVEVVIGIVLFIAGLTSMWILRHRDTPFTLGGGWLIAHLMMGMGLGAIVAIVAH